MLVKFLTSIASTTYSYQEGEVHDVIAGGTLRAWMDAGICEPVVETPPEAATEPPPPEAAVLPAARSHKRKHHPSEE
jgi:hypothetical protein